MPDITDSCGESSRPQESDEEIASMIVAKLVDFPREYITPMRLTGMLWARYERACAMDFTSMKARAEVAQVSKRVRRVLKTLTANGVLLEQFDQYGFFPDE